MQFPLSVNRDEFRHAPGRPPRFDLRLLRGPKLVGRVEIVDRDSYGPSRSGRNRHRSRLKCLCWDSTAPRTSYPQPPRSTSGTSPALIERIRQSVEVRFFRAGEKVDHRALGTPGARMTSPHK